MPRGNRASHRSLRLIQIILRLRQRDTGYEMGLEARLWTSQVLPYRIGGWTFGAAMSGFALAGAVAAGAFGQTLLVLLAVGNVVGHTLQGHHRVDMADLHV